MTTKCSHDVWIRKGKVYIANDDDSFYVQEFSSAEEVNSFIKLLANARHECFELETRHTKGASCAVCGCREFYSNESRTCITCKTPSRKTS